MSRSEASEPLSERVSRSSLIDSLRRSRNGGSMNRRRNHNIPQFLFTRHSRISHLCSCLQDLKCATVEEMAKSYILRLGDAEPRCNENSRHSGNCDKHFVNGTTGTWASDEPRCTAHAPSYLPLLCLLPPRTLFPIPQRLPPLFQPHPHRVYTLVHIPYVGRL